MDKETSDAMGLIYESIDGSDISFDPITTDEALDIFRGNPSYHLLDRLNGRPGDDFYKTDHYAIMYDGRMVGVIGFADYNRTWYGHKDMWDPEWGGGVMSANARSGSRFLRLIRT